MSISDEAFRELYKPLQVPAHFLADDTDENKIIFALAKIGKGTAGSVTEELKRIDIGIDASSYLPVVAALLNAWYERGLLGGETHEGEMQYDLQKITHANDGAVDPQKLAPGLD